MRNLSSIECDVAVPVNEELFLYCAALFQASANMSVPNIDIKGSNKQAEGIKLNDSPIVFGLNAVTNDLRQQDIPEHVVLAIGLRLIHIGGVLSAAERFSKWILRSDLCADDYDISESLLRACAAAQITMRGTCMAFNFDDIERLAQEIDGRDTSFSAENPHWMQPRSRRHDDYLH